VVEGSAAEVVTVLDGQVAIVTGVAFLAGPAGDCITGRTLQMDGDAGGWL
jgi:hypothetical protein